MITENLSTLKIHKLTQAQYDRELSAGNIDENALYLTPDEEITAEQIGAVTHKELEEILDNLEIPESAGDSAYEIAVKNGFEGSEEEWLASLKGETGNSGVYVGSGDMPEDCNVQIDPNGEAISGLGDIVIERTRGFINSEDILITPMVIERRLDGTFTFKALFYEYTFNTGTPDDWNLVDKWFDMPFYISEVNSCTVEPFFVYFGDEEFDFSDIPEDCFKIEIEPYCEMAEYPLVLEEFAGYQCCDVITWIDDQNMVNMCYETGYDYTVSGVLTITGRWRD